MTKESINDLLDFIDQELFKIELNIEKQDIIRESLKDIRHELYKAKSKIPPIIPKRRLVTMLYSEDIQRLLEDGFSDKEIATIVGISVKEVQAYAERRKTNG